MYSDRETFGVDDRPTRSHIPYLTSPASAAIDMRLRFGGGEHRYNSIHRVFMSRGVIYESNADGILVNRV